MFEAADLIANPAFNVAADRWQEKRVVKVFGAFASADEFLVVLQRSPVRCFYEIIRENTPCEP